MADSRNKYLILLYLPLGIFILGICFSLFSAKVTKLPFVVGGVFLLSMLVLLLSALFYPDRAYKTHYRIQLSAAIGLVCINFLLADLVRNFAPGYVPFCINIPLLIYALIVYRKRVAHYPKHGTAALKKHQKTKRNAIYLFLISFSLLNISYLIERLFPDFGIPFILFIPSFLVATVSVLIGMWHYYKEASNLYGVFDVDTVAHKIDEIGK